MILRVYPPCLALTLLVDGWWHQCHNIFWSLCTIDTINTPVGVKWFQRAASSWRTYGMTRDMTHSLRSNFFYRPILPLQIRRAYTTTMAAFRCIARRFCAVPGLERRRKGLEICPRGCCVLRVTYLVDGSITQACTHETDRSWPAVVSSCRSYFYGGP